MTRIACAVALAGMAAAVSAQTGSVNDAYIFGDGTSRVYQVTLGGAEVMNSRTGNSHFALSGDTLGIAPYRATWGGVNNNFYIGGFYGLTEIDGNTGALVKQIGTGTALDVQVSYLGTTLYRGDSLGIGEYDIASGARIRTLTGGVGAAGAHLMRARGTDLWVSGWNGSTVQRYDQASGALLQTITSTPFQCQALETDSYGNLYAAGLYDGAASSGVWKYDFGTGTWNMFAAATAAGGGAYPDGPHGFTFGIDGNLYVAFASGDVEVYNGATGAYMHRLWTVADKLTDIKFKPVPTPGGIALLGVAALGARRRRR